MRFWGKFSRAESAASFLQLSLKNIFFPKEDTQRGEIEKKDGRVQYYPAVIFSLFAKVLMEKFMRPMHIETDR